jgi:hypothetical protein
VGGRDNTARANHDLGSVQFGVESFNVEFPSAFNDTEQNFDERIEFLGQSRRSSAIANIFLGTAAP